MSRVLLKWCHVCLPVIYLALEIELILQKTLSMDEWHITCIDLSPFVTTIVLVFTSYPFPQQKAVATKQKVDILKTRYVRCRPFLYIWHSKIWRSDVIWTITKNTPYPFWHTHRMWIQIYIFMFCFTRSSTNNKLSTHNFLRSNAGDLED